MKQKKLVTFWTDNEQLNEFKINYPNSLSAFVRGCMSAALADQDFFLDMIKKDSMNNIDPTLED